MPEWNMAWNLIWISHFNLNNKKKFDLAIFTRDEKLFKVPCSMGTQGWALQLSVCHRQLTFTFGKSYSQISRLGISELLIIFLTRQPWSPIKGQTTDKGFWNSFLTKLLASFNKKYCRWCSWRAKKDNGTSWNESKTKKG